MSPICVTRLPTTTLGAGSNRLFGTETRRTVKVLLLGLLVSVALGARLGAADLSGRWTFTMDPDPRGNLATVECVFRQNGQRLVVKCGNGTSGGAVNGRKVTFRTPPAETEKGYILSFDGEIDERTITIKGTWRAVFPSLSEVREGKFRAVRRGSGSGSRR
jgi:hypothetical protein